MRRERRERERERKREREKEARERERARESESEREREPVLHPAEHVIYGCLAHCYRLSPVGHGAVAAVNIAHGSFA